MTFTMDQSDTDSFSLSSISSEPSLCSMTENLFDLAHLKPQASGELGRRSPVAPKNVWDQSGLHLDCQFGNLFLEPPAGRIRQGEIKLVILLPAARTGHQLLMHLGTIDGPDRFEEIGLVVIECTFQVLPVAGGRGIEPAIPVQQPGDPAQVRMGMQKRLLVPAGKGGNLPGELISGSGGKHGTVG